MIPISFCLGKRPIQAFRYGRSAIYPGNRESAWLRTQSKLTLIKGAKAAADRAGALAAREEFAAESVNSGTSGHSIAGSGTWRLTMRVSSSIRRFTAKFAAAPSVLFARYKGKAKAGEAKSAAGSSRLPWRQTSTATAPGARKAKERGRLGIKSKTAQSLGEPLIGAGTDKASLRTEETGQTLAPICPTADRQSGFACAAVAETIRYQPYVGMTIRDLYFDPAFDFTAKEQELRDLSAAQGGGDVSEELFSFGSEEEGSYLIVRFGYDAQKDELLLQGPAYPLGSNKKPTGIVHYWKTLKPPYRLKLDDIPLYMAAELPPLRFISELGKQILSTDPGRYTQNE